MRRGAALLLVSSAAAAFALPAQPSGRLSDFAGALDPAARSRIEAQLEGYARGRTHQIAVAIFRSLDGQPIEDASIRLAEKWKIGSRADDGVLVTVFTADRQLRIEVGYGLEEKLPDVVCARIIREEMVPRIRAGDLEGGITAGLAAIERAISGDAAAAAGHDRPARGGWSLDDLWGALAVPLVILLFILSPRLGLLSLLLGRRRRGGGGMPGSFPGGGGFSGGGGSFGGGGSSGKW
jgi:uncharacterized protein